jgi:hypothetical protein
VKPTQEGEKPSESGELGELDRGHSEGRRERRTMTYEMVERGRQTAESGDLLLLETVAGRLEGEEEESRRLLTEELLPGALRGRLMIRP